MFASGVAQTKSPEMIPNLLRRDWDRWFPCDDTMEYPTTGGIEWPKKLLMLNSTPILGQTFSPRPHGQKSHSIEYPAMKISGAFTISTFMRPFLSSLFSGVFFFFVGGDWQNKEQTPYFASHPSYILAYEAKSDRSGGRHAPKAKKALETYRSRSTMHLVQSLWELWREGFFNTRGREINRGFPRDATRVSSSFLLRFL